MWHSHILDDKHTDLRTQVCVQQSVCLTGWLCSSSVLWQATHTHTRTCSSCLITHSVWFTMLPESMPVFSEASILAEAQQTLLFHLLPPRGVSYILSIFSNKVPLTFCFMSEPWCFLVISLTQKTFDQSFNTASSALIVSKYQNYNPWNHLSGTNVSSGFSDSRKHPLVSNKVPVLEIRFLRKFLGFRKVAWFKKNSCNGNVLPWSFCFSEKVPRVKMHLKFLGSVSNPV